MIVHDIGIAGAYPPAMARQKITGAYFTPQALVEALVCWAVHDETDRLLDPSCGDGRFIGAHHKSVGIELEPSSAQGAIARAPWALVHEGDFFQWAKSTPERFECAAGNPPFIRYQHFSGDTRRRALELCLRHGAKFSGLTSSWAPFLVAAASLLKRGGRMAFVVPAEIGHAPYAAPLLEYLCANFGIVQVVAVREKLFPDLSEDCWLLYAEGRGDSTGQVRFTVLNRFTWSARPPATWIDVALADWRDIWNKRLRPFILPTGVRSLYREMVEARGAAALGAIAKIGIGYVSGDNDFFHLRPSEAEYWNIPERFLHPSARNSRSLPKKSIDRNTVRGWKSADQRVMLLRLPRSGEVPIPVRRYLDSPGGLAAREAYKCRNRAPWYSVPDVSIPDYVLTYMSGRSPALVRNAAGVTCTNTLHSIRVRDTALARKLLPGWSDPFTQLSCEIEGHPLGGGMLKLEVREAERVRLVEHGGLGQAATRVAREGVDTMRRWRHYAD